MEKNKTTIQVDKTLRDVLDKEKIIKQEPIQNVIKRIIEENKNMNLTEEEIAKKNGYPLDLYPAPMRKRQILIDRLRTFIIDAQDSKNSEVKEMSKNKREELKVLITKHLEFKRELKILNEKFGVDD